MPNYAIHDGATVHNVIVCDTQALAEELTEMQAVETTGVPWIGWTMEVEGWRAPQPGPEYVWDGTAWVVPEPEPAPPGE